MLTTIACFVRTGVSFCIASDGLMTCCAGRLRQTERPIAAERQRRRRVMVGGSLTRKYFEWAEITLSLYNLRDGYVLPDKHYQTTTLEAVARQNLWGSRVVGLFSDRLLRYCDKSNSQSKWCTQVVLFPRNSITCAWQSAVTSCPCPVPKCQEAVSI